MEEFTDQDFWQMEGEPKIDTDEIRAVAGEIRALDGASDEMWHPIGPAVLDEWAISLTNLQEVYEERKHAESIRAGWHREVLKMLIGLSREERASALGLACGLWEASEKTRARTLAKRIADRHDVSLNVAKQMAESDYSFL